MISRAVLTLMLAAPAADAGPTPDPEQLRALQRTVRAAIAAAEPSVACVLVSRSKRYREFEVRADPTVPGTLGDFQPPRFAADPARRDLARRLDLAEPDVVPETVGSGVVVDRSGLVLTSYHLIRGATKIYVRLAGGDGCYADVHAADQRADLAVLRLIDPPIGLAPVRLGDGGAAEKGDWVVCLTYPFAVGFRDGSPSASLGVVSNLRRRSEGPAEEWVRTKPLHAYGTLLQTDARFAVSGGALVNLDGELIGLTSRLIGPTGGDTAQGFAVPMDGHLKRILDVLKQGREVEYGFLGVSVSEYQDGNGARLQYVSRGSPAHRAGLRRDDTVVEVDGRPVRELDDLFLHVGAALAGTEVDVKVRRAGGEVASLRAELAKFRHDLESIASRPPPSVRGLRVDYSSVLTTNLAQGEIPAGVLLLEVEEDSPAEAALREQVQPGSQLIVTEVNGRPVVSPDEFRSVAGSARGPLRLTARDAGRPDEKPITLTIPAP